MTDYEDETPHKLVGLALGDHHSKFAVYRSISTWNITPQHYTTRGLLTTFRRFSSKAVIDTGHCLQNASTTIEVLTLIHKTQNIDRLLSYSIVCVDNKIYRVTYCVQRRGEDDVRLRTVLRYPLLKRATSSSRWQYPAATMPFYIPNRPRTTQLRPPHWRGLN